MSGRKLEGYKERRKEFEKKVSINMYRKQGRSRWAFYTNDVSKIHKVMSNADRRILGVKQDPNLEDYKP